MGSQCYLPPDRGENPAFIFIFIHQKTVEKKNNTKTIKSERKANNLTKQLYPKPKQVLDLAALEDARLS